MQFGKMTLTYLLAVVTFLATKGGMAEGACATMADVGADAAALASCLQQIKDVAQDNAKFWFGTSSISECSAPGLSFTEKCFNPHPTRDNSISSLFNPSLDVSNLDRLVEVKYTSEKGEYVGCDFHFKMDERLELSIDPTADTAYPVWTLRALPEVTWRTDPGKQYTLAIVDAGSGILHGIYANIDGTDIASSTIVDKYHGPLNPRTRPNVYIFALYEQNTKDITVDASWLAEDTFTGAVTFYNLGDFASAYSLRGPIGLNILQAAMDGYSAGRMRDIGVMDNCVIFIRNALASPSHDRPWLPQDEAGREMLDTTMTIVFTSKPINFTICCDSYPYSGKTFTLDPVGAPNVTTADTRSTNTSRDITLRKSNKVFPKPAEDLLGTMHTLIMVDPDVPNAAFGTNERPLLHMLITNIADGNVTSGKVIKSYSGPMPPDQSPHTYYYLLYKQTGTLAVESVEGYTCDAAPTRCLFDVSRFVSDNSLTLVGVNWMVAQNDAYVWYSHITERDRDPKEVCQYADGYADPCPVGKGYTLTYNLFILLVSLFLVSFSVKVQ